LLKSNGSSGNKKISESRTLSLITSAVCGAIFGFVMQKGHVHEPKTIRDQMLFQQWTMMKMFLAAAAMSIVAIAAVIFLPGGRSLVVRARAWAFSGYRGVVAALLGGITLGAGMSLAGACPGTIPIQIGSGIRWSLFTAAGALTGALVFAIVEPSILRDLGILRSGMLSNPTWDSLTGLPYVVVAGFMAAVFAGCVYYIENYIAPSSFFGGRVSLSLTDPQWPSWVSGIVVGFLQLPMLYLATETLGASRAYVTLVANCLSFIAPGFVNNNSYLSGAKSGTANFSQLVFVFCACVGSFLSCVASGSSFSGVSGFTPISSFVGGFLVVFGGRLAGGCTSGQGLSGNGVLAINGMAATAGIFIGAIPVAKFAQTNGF